MHPLAIAAAAAVAVASCQTSPDLSPKPTPSGDFDTSMEALRVKHGLGALGVGVLSGGRLTHAGGYGVADSRSGTPARADTLFSLASVSKIFVGLAIARAAELGVTIDLDADVNDLLGWSPPLAHPDFPETPVTLRQLVQHRSGIASDGPDDYDTYPKPDPTGTLEAFLKNLLASPDSWMETAPGEAEEYSNLGTALAALVVEKAVGKPFEVFCNDEVFTPLGMFDTRWFYRELTEAQRRRLARPEGEDGPLEHYGFGDWPSGQLRSTVGDLAKAMIMLMSGGRHEGESFLGTSALALFHDTPLFIGLDDGAYNHSGGEAGVNTYVEYATNGKGLIVLTNQDLEDAAIDAMFEDVEAALRSFAGD
jgi:CubicO group peptidase (beta-lactamase class C family)